MDKLNFILKEGQHVYFTSDLHFGHKNILKFCNRPFTDIKEMAQEMKQRWNDVVNPDDIIFVLGDFSWFTGRHEIWNCIKSLHGNIYIIPGNHDVIRGFEISQENCDRIHVLSDIVHVWIRDEFGRLPKSTVELCLSHYPLMTWSHRQSRCINLFGHIHSDGRIHEDKFDLNLPLWSYQYDVGVDANEYRPVSLQEIIQKIDWPDRDPLKLATYRANHDK